LTELKKRISHPSRRLLQMSMANASQGQTRQRMRLDMGTLNNHVGYFTRRFQVWIFKDFIRTLASLNIRPAQYSVLTAIGCNPGRSQADIGEALGIERARVVRVLDELEKRGFIQRFPSTQDRRSHCLFLTKEGHENLERIRLLAAEHEAHVVRKIGARRRATLIKLMKEVARACEK
jgi:DNA-binding MarR family transcriptional regulator